jgi:uncharacterized membrane protein YhaH (DUF805 family)
MGFGEAIKSGYRQYFQLHGNATRSEYWYFILYLALLFIPMTVLLAVATGVLKAADVQIKAGTGGKSLLTAAIVLLVLACVPLLAVLVSLIPAFTLQVRRLHDAGQSGWWILVSMILSSLSNFFQFLQKTHPQPSVTLVHVGLMLASSVIGLVILFFLVQPSKAGYDGYGSYRGSYR